MRSFGSSAWVPAFAGTTCLYYSGLPWTALRLAGTTAKLSHHSNTGKIASGTLSVSTCPRSLPKR
jgi:hypothetical protein